MALKCGCRTAYVRVATQSSKQPECYFFVLPESNVTCDSPKEILGDTWERLQGWLRPLGSGHVLQLQLWPKWETDHSVLSGHPSTQRLVRSFLGHIPPPGRMTPNCYRNYRNFITGWSLWICGFTASTAVPFLGHRGRTPGLE